MKTLFQSQSLVFLAGKANKIEEFILHLENKQIIVEEDGEDDYLRVDMEDEVPLISSKLDNGKLNIEQNYFGGGPKKQEVLLVDVVLSPLPRMDESEL